MLAAPDVNNNTILDIGNQEREASSGHPPQDETEMRLSIRNNRLHLYNPQFGIWIPADNLELEKKLYLYNALASNITNQLKDVGNTVKRQLKLSQYATTTCFKFLSGIKLETNDLGNGEKKAVYNDAIQSVAEELVNFNGLHEELDKYYAKLEVSSGSPSTVLKDTAGRPLLVAEEENEIETLNKDLEDRLFIKVPWDWNSTFLTNKEFPAFSNMASNGKLKTGKRTENMSLVKLFKKSQDRPPMEPTWMKPLEAFPSGNYNASPELGIPCVVLRKLGFFYGSYGEQTHNFELVTGTKFTGDYNLMDYLLPAAPADISERSRITFPIAFRHVAFTTQDQKSGDLSEEVEQPRPTDIGTILRTIQGLSTGTCNSINKAAQLITRTLSGLDTRNDQFVFQRAIQNVHMYGDYAQTTQLKLTMERINDQAAALRLMATTGSEAIGQLIKLFQTIISRMRAFAEIEKKASSKGRKDTLVGKVELSGEDIIRTNFEDWFRSANTIPMLTELSATGAGVSGILLKLQDAYQQVGSALLNVVSNPVEGVKVSFEDSVEAICALLVLAEVSVGTTSVSEEWLVKEILNTLEETKNATSSLKGTINRISTSAEILQNTSDSAVFTLQEITVIRKKQYEKMKKKEEGGFWRFGFGKDKKNTSTN